MDLHQTDIKELLTSNHPARPYLIAGAFACGLGLLRSNLGGALLIAAGSISLLRGLDEIQKTNRLHGGNFHGTNGPSPRNLEKLVSMQ